MRSIVDVFLFEKKKKRKKKNGYEHVAGDFDPFMNRSDVQFGPVGEEEEELYEY